MSPAPSPATQQRSLLLLVVLVLAVAALYWAQTVIIPLALAVLFHVWTPPEDPRFTVCLFRRLTGIPCPLCGMTTSVTAAVHLHLGPALAANPAGVAAVAVAVVILALPRLRRVRVPSWLAPVVLALMWAYELVRFRLV